MARGVERSVLAALVSGPRYLMTAWPWRAVAWCVSGAVLGLIITVAALPLLLSGVSRRVRTALWAPLLELEAARLALVDEEAGARVRNDVLAARAGDRLPTVRHVGYLSATALITGPIAGVLTAGLLLVTSLMLGAPLLVSPGDPINVGPWVVDTPIEAWAACLLGIPAGVISAYLVGGFAGAVAHLSVAALSDPGALQREVTRLGTTRSDLLHAVEQERRRIESELHDRVQHRLVALSLTLGLAESRHGEDETGRLAAEAQRQLDDALGELRAVLLGIQPRALTEHGLVPAVMDLVGAYPLSVTCHFGSTEASPRLPALVEQVAYLVISESLTNVIKHAGAGGVSLAADRDEDSWWLVITDDGRGGADPDAGRGLSLLAARVAALDGELMITSPVGGPTETRMRCPI
ncbi:MAG: histidine kinase [Propionibacteriaceae bacterium]